MTEKQKFLETLYAEADRRASAETLANKDGTRLGYGVAFHKAMVQLITENYQKLLHL